MMTKELQEYIIEKTNEMIRYDFCCPEARAAAEKWLGSIGTDKEQQIVSEYINELEECIMPVDDLIEFCKGELAFFIFGDSQEAEIEHAYKLKADGIQYCDCPVCKAAQDILEKKVEIINKV